MINKQIKFTAAMLFAITFSMHCSQAQSNVDMRVVGSAVPFLRISPDARSGGMADVGIATSPDANAAFYNNAKSVFAADIAGININYIPWMSETGFNDVYLATFAGYYKLDDKQAVTASMRYFSLGDIQFVDMSGNKLETYQPREIAVDLGYARKLSQKLSLGIALRIVNSGLATNQYVGGNIYENGTSAAGDISMFYDARNPKGEGISAGMALTNLGAKISYSQDVRQKDYLPANIGLGVAYTKVIQSKSKLVIGADLNKLMVPTPPENTAADYDDKMNSYYNKGVVSSWFSSFGDAPGGFSEEIQEINLSVGAEYIYNDLVMIRAGYFYENKVKGDRQYATAGAGVKYNKLTLNFAYLVPAGSGLNRSPLSNTFRFGLSFNVPGK